MASLGFRGPSGADPVQLLHLLQHLDSEVLGFPFPMVRDPSLHFGRELIGLPKLDLTGYRAL